MTPRALLAAMALTILSTMSHPQFALAAGFVEGDPAVKNGTIAYAWTDRYWAVYESKDGKTECPQGMNDGPREQFKQLFPDDGKKRTVVETQLAREGYQWHPTTTPESFPFHEAQGKISYGLNLDGKVGPDDFKSPEGEEGIDNQLYRVIGCIADYRSSGSIYHFENEYVRRYNDNRWIIEISGVQDLTNSPDVTVTTYRGLDSLLTDATGDAFLPGGTIRADLRWGKQFVYKIKGSIKDGVLITEPVDTMEVPWGATFNTNGYQLFRGLRFKLKLTPTTAEGLVGGYVDVESFVHHLNTSWSTHHQSYGQHSSPSQYRAMKRLADGYPDPQTGTNTAISSAVTVKFIRIYLDKPPQATMVTKN
jgi:hypothetical protein